MRRRTAATPIPTSVPFTSSEFNRDEYLDWLSQELYAASNVVIANPTSGNFVTALLYEYAGSKPIFIPAGEYGSPISVHNALELVIKNAPSSTHVHFQNTRIPTTRRTLDLLRDAEELFGGVCFSDHWVWPNNSVLDELSRANRYPLKFREKQVIGVPQNSVSEQRLQRYLSKYHPTEVAQHYAQSESAQEVCSTIGRSATQAVRDDFWDRGVEIPQWLHDLVDTTAVLDFNLRTDSSPTTLLDERAFDLEVYSHSVGYDEFITGVKQEGLDIREQASVETPFSKIESDPSQLLSSLISVEEVVWDSLESRKGKKLDIAVVTSAGPAEFIAELLLRGRADVVSVLGRDGTFLVRSDGQFDRYGAVAESFGGRGHSLSGWAVIESVTSIAEFDSFVRPAIENIVASIRNV